MIMVIRMKESGITTRFKATEFIQRIKIKPSTKGSLRSGGSKERVNSSSVMIKNSLIKESSKIIKSTDKAILSTKMAQSIKEVSETGFRMVMAFTRPN